MTGATGFIGYNIALLLLKKNIQVLNIYNEKYSDKNGRRLKKLKNYKLFSDCTIADLNGNFGEFDVILHLASYGVDSSENKLEELFAGNTLFTYKILEHAKLFKTKIIYFTTAYEFSSSVNKIEIDSKIDPKSPYSIFKYSTTQYLKYYCRKHSLQHLILKLFPTYGPQEGYHKLVPSIIKRICEDDFIEIKQPNNICDYLYIQDLVRLIEYILTKEKFIRTEYIVSSGSGYTVKEILTNLVEIIDRSYNKIIYHENNNKNVYVGNNEMIMKDYNWNPIVDLREGLLLTYKHYKNEL
jgi:nucleoside-diphosphate-sugar epimerase